MNNEKVSNKNVYKDIHNLKKIVKYIANVLDTPGIGGNVSVKTEGGLYIKASGTQIRCQKLKLIKEEYGKPSIELELHKRSPYKFVIHYHPVYLIPFINENLVQQFDNACILDYYMPGSELAKAYENVKGANVIFLKNHGVVVQSDNYKECIRIILSIKEKYQFVISKYLCPDDYVMKDNEEQILANACMLLLKRLYNTEIELLDNEDIRKLAKSKDEQYRQELNA